MYARNPKNNTRPFLDLLKLSMRQQRLSTVVELTAFCKGHISKPTVYSVYSGVTPYPNILNKIIDLFGMNTEVATAAWNDQREIDRTLRRARKKPQVKKKDSLAGLTIIEKRLVKKYRSLSERGQNSLAYILTHMVSADKT